MWDYYYTHLCVETIQNELVMQNNLSTNKERGEIVLNLSEI